VANSPDIAKYYIQQHNIKKRISKGEPTVPPSPLPNEDNDEVIVDKPENLVGYFVK
jgi:hypothetical protein